MTIRVESTVTSGTFSLDGGTWKVDNNVWVIGDDDECVVIDAPHRADPIVDLIGDRNLLAILCTHAHDDHVTVANELVRPNGRAGATASRRRGPVAHDLSARRLRTARRRRDRRGRRKRAAGPPHAGTCAGCCVFLRAGSRRGVHRRHPVQGRTRRDRTLVLGLRHDRRLDPIETAPPAAGDGGAHRARRGHHHRAEAAGADTWTKPS